MKIILVPDEGEWVLVPKVATDEMVRAELEAKHRGRKMATVYAAMLAAAPPCKVVELPERRALSLGSSASEIVFDVAFNSYRDEIERRAK